MAYAYEARAEPSLLLDFVDPSMIIGIEIFQAIRHRRNWAMIWHGYLAMRFLSIH